MVQDHSNVFVSTCSFKCTEGGGSAICWKNIMDHFTDGLQMALRDYVSAVGHASHWQHQHNRDSTVDIVAESLQGRLSDDGPLNRSELIAIFKAILNMVGQYIPASPKFKQFVLHYVCSSFTLKSNFAVYLIQKTNSGVTMFYPNSNKSISFLLTISLFAVTTGN